MTRIYALISFCMQLMENNRRKFYILGVIGWILLAINFPFGWELPKYATY